MFNEHKLHITASQTMQCRVWLLAILAFEIEKLNNHLSGQIVKQLQLIIAAHATPPPQNNAQTTHAWEQFAAIL